MKRFLLLFALPVFLASCVPAKEPPPLMIESIVSSKGPIDPAKPLPEFTTHFATGTTVVNSYVSLRNFESMTGTYVVRMRWHYPNDFRPPMAQRVVTLNAGQNVAQFSLHDEKGLANGPYLLDARAGKDEMTLTASGSARFFVGMTEKESEEYLKEEAQYKKNWEAERAKREEEQKKADEEKRALEEKLSWEKRLLGSGATTGDKGSASAEAAADKEGIGDKGGFSSPARRSFSEGGSEGVPQERDGRVEKQGKDLPPALTGGE